jgi:hypothetical protein
MNSSILIKKQITSKISKNKVELWKVNIVQELEDYLKEVSELETFENKATRLNFAEAGLLVQGSAQLYSKKVESLYDLVHDATIGIQMHKINKKELMELDESKTKAFTIMLCDQSNLLYESEDFFELEYMIKEGKNIDLNERKKKTNKKLYLYEPAPVVLSYITCDTTGENITASKLSKYTLHSYSGALLIDESYDRCEFNQIQPLSKFRGSSFIYNNGNTGLDELNIIINNSSRNSPVIYPNNEIIVSLMNKNKTEVNHYIKNQDYKVCYKRYWQMLDAYEPGGLPFKPLKQQKKFIE